MPDLLWEHVAEWFDFEPDGSSLRDAYIFGTTTQDWQKFIDLIRSRGWWYQYEQDGRPSRLPARVTDIFQAARVATTALRIKPVPTLLINTYFFTPDELECDLDRQDIRDQDHLDALCGFLRATGRALGKPIVLTPENCPEHPLAVYDPDLGRIVA